MDSCLTKVLVFFAATLSSLSADSNRICEVSVLSQKVNATLFLPQNSTVHITCSADQLDVTLFWELQSTDIQRAERYTSDNEQIFQSFGYYQNRDNVTNILLYINTTDLNQTNVTCVGVRFGMESNTLFRRTLWTYDTNQETFMLVPNTMNGTGRILLSWSPSTSLGARQVYNVTAVGTNTQPESFLKSEPNFDFSAPDDAPSCEVYNFSVTATPVGATYTGDGCSVSSGILTVMLPSLPNINFLESSLNYTLDSGTGTGFRMEILITPADYCTDYPVTDYVLEVEGPTTSIMSITPGSINTVDNLLENEMYSFHIVVSNSVGNVSTNKTVIYTTDVQDVTAVSTEHNSFIVRCVFVTGSTARGCMVVLVGQPNNTTVNLTREGLCATGTAEISTTTSIFGLIGYDIEFDGTLGTLAIEGGFSNESLSCTDDKNDIVLVVAVTVPGAVLVIIISPTSIAIIIHLYRKHKKSHYAVKAPEVEVCFPMNTTAEETAHVDKEELDKAVPIYESPTHKRNVGVRTAGDGEDHSTGRYDITAHARDSPKKDTDINKDTCTATYAELMDDKHFYFTLESSRPPQGVKVSLSNDDILSAPDEAAPPLPPPYNPDQDSQTPPPPPVYHDINNLQSRI